MAVHYYPGIGAIAYYFWPVKILTPVSLDLASVEGGPILRGLDRRLGRLGLVRSVKVLDRDV